MAFKHPTVFWDWDGTITDTMPVYIKAFQAAHVAFNLPPVTAEDVYRNTSGTSHGHFSKCLPPEKVDEAIAYCYTVINATSYAMFPEARGWLEEVVARGSRNVIISNKRHEALLGDIKRFEVGHLISAAVGGNELANHKPHPDHMYLAAQRAGVAVSEADAMVGDSPSDYHIAKATGTFAYLLHSEVHDFTGFIKECPKLTVVSRPLLHKTLFQG